jgi:hypothetical protein
MTLLEWQDFLRGEHPEIFTQETAFRTPLDPEAYEATIARWAQASFHAQEAEAARTQATTLDRQQRSAIREALFDLDSFADALVDEAQALTVMQIRRMLARVCRVLAALIRYQIRDEAS